MTESIRAQRATDVGSWSFGGHWPTATTVMDAKPLPLAGRRVRLQMVGQEHYGFLHRLNVQPEEGFRWRHQGRTPSPEEAVRSLWNGTLAQFIIETSDGLKPLGLVNAHNADHRNATASFALVSTPEARGSTKMLDGLFIFMNYLFTNWPFRKLYAEVLEYNMVQFRGSGSGLYVVEGCLRKHSYYANRYWDKYIICIYRDVWESVGTRYLDFALGLTENSNDDQLGV